MFKSIFFQLLAPEVVWNASRAEIIIGDHFFIHASLLMTDRQILLLLTEKMQRTKLIF